MIKNVCLTNTFKWKHDHNESELNDKKVNVPKKLDRTFSQPRQKNNPSYCHNVSKENKSGTSFFSFLYIRRTESEVGRESFYRRALKYNTYNFLGRFHFFSPRDQVFVLGEFGRFLRRVTFFNLSNISALFLQWLIVDPFLYVHSQS